MFEDTYRTISGISEGVFRDKGSKFIAYAYPFKDESDLREIIAGLKALHPKARHHCWAYRISPDRQVFRVNDDGEPSGTAGRPILNTLLSADVTDVLVVVVRYFGGTLLGVPGLINAYKSATKEALDVAEIVEKTIKDIYSLSFDYLMMNDVMRTIKEEDLQIVEQIFDNQCVIQVGVRQSHREQVITKFENLQGVQVKFVRTI